MPDLDVHMRTLPCRRCAQGPEFRRCAAPSSRRPAPVSLQICSPTPPPRGRVGAGRSSAASGAITGGGREFSARSGAPVRKTGRPADAMRDGLMRGMDVRSGSWVCPGWPDGLGVLRIAADRQGGARGHTAARIAAWAHPWCGRRAARLLGGGSAFRRDVPAVPCGHVHGRQLACAAGPRCPGKACRPATYGPGAMPRPTGGGEGLVPEMDCAVGHCHGPLLWSRSRRFSRARDGLRGRALPCHDGLQRTPKDAGRTSPHPALLGRRHRGRRPLPPATATRYAPARAGLADAAAEDRGRCPAAAAAAAAPFPQMPAAPAGGACRRRSPRRRAFPCPAERACTAAPRPGDARACRRDHDSVLAWSRNPNWLNSGCIGYTY